MRKTFYIGLFFAVALMAPAALGAQDRNHTQEAIQVVCPASVNVFVNREIQETTLNYLIPQGVSECSGNDVIRTLMQGPANGERFQIGATQVVYSFADTCGNEVVCSFIVNVLPTLAQYETSEYGQETEARNETQNISLAGLRIWPNPTGETLHVEFPAPLEGRRATFRVVDVAGQIVLTRHAEISGATFSLQLPSGINAGIYFLEAQIDQTKMDWMRFSVAR